MRWAILPRVSICLGCWYSLEDGEIKRGSVAIKKKALEVFVEIVAGLQAGVEFWDVYLCYWL